MQSKFIERFANLAPKEWHIRIETSLNVGWKAIETLIPYIDQWIIDIKDMNNDIYKEYTGTNNVKMKKNLKKLVELVPMEKLYIRIPNIRGYNTDKDVDASIKELSDIECFKEVFDYVYYDTCKTYKTIEPEKYHSF